MTVTAIKTLIWSIIVGGTATVGIPYLLLTATGASLSLRLLGFRLFGLVLIILGATIYVWSANHLRGPHVIVFPPLGRPLRRAGFEKEIRQIVRGLLCCGVSLVSEITKTER